MVFNIRSLALAAGVVASASSLAPAGAIQITEWFYGNTANEFVELTNTGATSVDFTNWSLDDDSELPDTVSLTGFGLVAPGESVIVTEATPAAFRTNWSLPATVKIVGSVTTNFGRADEYNIFDADDLLVDRLKYDDQTLTRTPRTNVVSAIIPPSQFDSQVATPFMPLAKVGDIFGSYKSATTDIGNPGTFVAPEPASLLSLGAASLLLRRRRIGR